MSVAVKVAIAVAPAVEGMLEMVALFAVGGLFPIGIVIVAILEIVPRLSVAVKVNVSFPVNVPLGSYLIFAASVSDNPCPAVAALPPTAKVPWVGKVEMV